MQNREEMYFDLEALRIAGKYVEEDVHISSIIKLLQQITLKPRHMHTCKARSTLRNGCGMVYEIEQLNRGYTSNLSCIAMTSVVVQLNKSHRFLLFIMTNTNQIVTSKRDYLIAKLSEVGIVS